MFPGFTLEMWNSPAFTLPFWGEFVLLALAAVGTIVFLGYARAMRGRAEEAEKKEAEYRRAA